MENTAISSPKNEWMNEGGILNAMTCILLLIMLNREFEILQFEMMYSMHFLLLLLLSNNSLFFLLKIAISHVSVVWQFYYRYLINIKTTYLQEEWKLENCV